MILNTDIVKQVETRYFELILLYAKLDFEVSLKCVCGFNKLFWEYVIPLENDAVRKCF